MNFSLPSYPDLGRVDIVVYTYDGMHINSWNDQGDSAPVMIPQPGNYYAAVTSDPVTISEAGYAYDTFYNSPYRFTINPTDSGVITIDIPELQPVNAEVVITSNLAAGHGTAISSIEHLNYTGSWEQIAGETLPGTLILPPGVYRFTTRTVTIERAYWTEVLTTADEHVIVGLSSGHNGGIYFEYEIQPSLGVSITPLFPGVQHTFTLTDANNNQYDHTDTQVPPGEYTITYDPIDVTNTYGRNGISPTYERLQPSILVQTIHLSSNQQLTNPLVYWTPTRPAINLTITAPDDANHPFQSDVWIRGQHEDSEPLYVQTASNNQVLHGHFGRYCVEANDTTNFVVTSNNHAGTCFDLDTSRDYDDGDYAVEVVINYEQRSTVNATVSFPDSPTGEAPEGAPSSSK